MVAFYLVPSHICRRWKASRPQSVCLSDEEDGDEGGCGGEVLRDVSSAMRGWWEQIRVCTCCGGDEAWHSTWLLFVKATWVIYASPHRGFSGTLQTATWIGWCKLARWSKREAKCGGCLFRSFVDFQEKLVSAKLLKYCPWKKMVDLLACD